MGWAGGGEWEGVAAAGCVTRPAGVHLEPEGTFQIPSDWGNGNKSRPILEWKIKADSSGTYSLPTE